MRHSGKKESLPASGGWAERAPAREPAGHAPRALPGGPTTKIHLAADGRCRPPGFVLTPGQAEATPVPVGACLMAAVYAGRGPPGQFVSAKASDEIDGGQECAPVRR